MAKLKLFTVPKNKYLLIGIIGLSVIGASWLFPRLVRQVAENVSKPLPSETAAVVPIAAPAGGRLGEMTVPNIINPVDDAIGVLRLSNVYRATANIGVSPRHNRVLI